MKRNLYLNGIFCLALLLFSGLSANAQKTELIEKIKSQVYSDDWELLEENDNIIIYAKYSDCSQPEQGFNFEYLLFKIVNKTSNPVHVLWDFDYSYNHRPRHDESDDEVMISVTIDPNEKVETSCSSTENKRMRLFVRDKNNPGMRELTDFSINNLKVTNL
jgi:hypothetical protein